MSARWVPAQNPGAAPASSAGQIRRLFTVGDPVTGQNRSFGVAFFNQDPVRLGQGVSVVNRVMADGTLFMSDYAGAALLRFGAGRARVASTGSSGQGQILLDSSWHDPEDPDVGLARILGVATNRDGVSAVLALRADDTYCIYQLKDGALKRLVGPANGVYSTELAISDDGRIAYVAYDAVGNELPKRGQTLFSRNTNYRTVALAGGAGSGVVLPRARKSAQRMPPSRCCW